MQKHILILFIVQFALVESYCQAKDYHIDVPRTLDETTTKDELLRSARLVAKMEALERTGTYLSFEFEMSEYKLTKADIISFSEGYIQCQYLKKEELSNYQIIYSFKITIDEQQVKRRIEKELERRRKSKRKIDYGIRGKKSHVKSYYHWSIISLEAGDDGENFEVEIREGLYGALRAIEFRTSNKLGLGFNFNLVELVRSKMKIEDTYLWYSSLNFFQPGVFVHSRLLEQQLGLTNLSLNGEYMPTCEINLDVPKDEYGNISNGLSSYDNKVQTVGYKLFLRIDKNVYSHADGEQIATVFLKIGYKWFNPKKKDLRPITNIISETSVIDPSGVFITIGVCQQSYELLFKKN